MANSAEPDPETGVLPDSPWGGLFAAAPFVQDGGYNAITPEQASDQVGVQPVAGAYQNELELQNQALRYSQRMAEGALERFSALFSNVPLALLVLDESGLILESNTQALANLRPEETDPPLTYFLPLVMPADRARVMAGLAEAKKEGGFLLPHVLLYSGQATTLTADIHLAPIENPQDDLTNFICALVDQGPLLRQMAQKEALESQLRESQKMQAIGTLAGGIAHDFNNILGAILGNAQLAQQDLAQSASVPETKQTDVLTSLVEIEKAAMRARDLVNQILTFSRKEPLARSPIELAGVVEEAARLIRLGLSPPIRLELQTGSPVPLVLADATQVQQALLNLCQNAVQALQTDAHSPTDGVISLSLTLDTQQNPHQVLLSVADNGPGMDASVQARVFDPFFTTKPVGEGTGLGLSVVHGIMRAHDGSVAVQSAVGRGSVFTLRFNAAPVKIAPAVKQQPIASSFEPARHLMYVDDDPALVFLVQRAFTRQGVNVTGFTDPRQALQTLADPGVAIDLLVTDYNMPGFTGLDLLLEARRLRPTLRVALASGYVTPEIDAAARAAGAAGVLFKPSGVDELSAAISQLMSSPKLA